MFSVQNSKPMYSVEFSTDLVQIQVRRTVSKNFLARMDIPIQVWHMVEVMRRGFNGHHMTQVPITDHHLGTMQMMEEVSDHVGMNYPDTFVSRYVVQPIDDFLFPWGEGSVESAHTIEKERGSLSQELKPANHQDNHRRWRQDQLCASLRNCKTLRTQRLDSSLICKSFGYCRGFCNSIFFLHPIFFQEIGTMR